MKDSVMRIGQGFDVHAFAPDRRLVLGGVEVPFEKGLAGHSDADVLIHAVFHCMIALHHSPITFFASYVDEIHMYRVHMRITGPSTISYWADRMHPDTHAKMELYVMYH